MKLNKNKIILSCVLAFLFSLALHAQKTDFEGKITYVLSMVSKKENITDKALKLYFGDTVVVAMKNGNYHQKYLNADGITDIIYSASNNNLHYKINNVDTLYEIDCSEPASKLLKSGNSDAAETILGYNCKTFVVNTDANKSMFFYAKDLYVDPAHFSNYRLYFYHLFAVGTESVYLKSINEDSFSKSIITAIKVERKPIDDILFELPLLPKVKTKAGQ